MQNFRNLAVWQKAHELALFSYRITNDFPKDEIFGLRLSMRRAAIDIPGFIAEGCGKSNDPEFSRSISAALATAGRLEYYSLVAKDLELLPDPIYSEYEKMVIEVKKMLGGFNRRLQ